jgi:hypothetical protein
MACALHNQRCVDTTANLEGREAEQDLHVSLNQKANSLNAVKYDLRQEREWSSGVGRWWAGQGSPVQMAP